MQFYDIYQSLESKNPIFFFFNSKTKAESLFSDMKSLGRAENFFNFRKVGPIPDI